MARASPLWPHPRPRGSPRPAPARRGRPARAGPPPPPGPLVQPRRLRAVSCLFAGVASGSPLVFGDSHAALARCCTLESAGGVPPPSSSYAGSSVVFGRQSCFRSEDVRVGRPLGGKSRRISAGVDGVRWRPRSSKPLWGCVAVPGGFDPHALPPPAVAGPCRRLLALLAVAGDSHRRSPGLAGGRRPCLPGQLMVMCRQSVGGRPGLRGPASRGPASRAAVPVWQRCHHRARITGRAARHSSASPHSTR